MPRPLPRFHHQPQADVTKVARIVAELDELEVTTTAAGGTAPGDERRLRGIPAIRRGCAGAINGTRPDTAFLGRQTA